MDDNIAPYNPRSRPRPTLSCLVCRRKKLRCDRSHPCDQCVRSHRPDECSYAAQGSSSASPITNETTWTRTASSGESPAKRPRTDDYTPIDVSTVNAPLLRTVESLVTRVAQLERQMADLVGNGATANAPAPTPKSAMSEKQNQSHPGSGKTEDDLTMKKDRTRFNGTVKQLLHRVVRFHFVFIRITANKNSSLMLWN